MQKYFLFITFFLSTILNLNAQNVGIGIATPNASAALDVSSNSKGLLIPRVTSTQRNAIVNPARGLLLYDSTIKSLFIHDGILWKDIAAGSSKWALAGNDISNTNSGNVGIGMAATSAKLALAGTLAMYSGTTNTATIEPNGNNLTLNTIFGAPLPLPGTIAGNLILQYSPFTSFPAGKVGIGNNTPEQKLHISGNAIMDGANPFFTLRNGITGTQKATMQLSGTNLLLGTDAGNDGEVQLKQNGQIKFSVDVFGNIVQNNTSPYFTIQNGGVNKAYLNVSGNEFGIGTYSGNTTGKINFVTNGSTKAVIDAAGNYGIGTFTPSFKLDVAGTDRIEAPSGSNALELKGPLKVGGSNPTAFKIVATSTGRSIIIDNPICNNDPNALIFITPLQPFQTVYVEYNTTLLKWEIVLSFGIYPRPFTTCFTLCTGGQPVGLLEPADLYINPGDAFNVLVIKQ
jgi:hypothetical protein